MTKEKAKSTAGERRAFRMHPRLLYYVMTRQAGTVEKAWFEAVQNSIDAEATEISFTISEKEFTVKDNGKGMSWEEIEQYFEEFGATSKSAEDLGEFGIGRGQIFAMGRVTWITRMHTLKVDIKDDPEHYRDMSQLIEPYVRGTEIRVRFYQPLKRLNNHIAKLKEGIAYVDIPVIINGERLPVPRAPDYEDEDCKLWFDISGDTLRIYNRGIFVKEEYKGVGVTMVSKKNLKVNLARNDIIYDDELYQRIVQTLDTLLTEKFSNATYLSNDNKKAVLQLIATNPEARTKLADKPVFKGGERYYSLNEIQQSGTYTVGFHGNSVMIDKVQESGMIVLNSHLPEELSANATLENWSSVIERLGITDDSKIIGADEETKAKLEEVQRFVSTMSTRRIKLGSSSLSAAWTDGKTYIVLTKQLFAEGNWRDHVWEPVIHEVAHDDDTEKTDVHGEDFDRHYRDMIQHHSEMIAAFIRGAFEEKAK